MITRRDLFGLLVAAPLAPAAALSDQPARYVPGCVTYVHDQHTAIRFEPVGRWVSLRDIRPPFPTQTSEAA